MAVEAHRDRLGHGERREQPRLLERAAEAEHGALVGRQVGDVFVAEFDAAAVGGVEARDDVEQRGLAGAVVTDETDDAPGRDLEVGVVEGADAAEVLRDFRGTRRPTPRSRRSPSLVAAVAPSASALAAADEHRAQDVGPFEQLGGRALKRTAPFSRNTARCASSMATLTDCSTATIVVPAAWISRTFSHEHADDRGREAERELVDQHHLRLGDERHGERELLLFAAGQVAGELAAALAEDREHLEHLVGRGRGARSWSRRICQHASRRFSATVIVGKTPRPPGIIASPRAAISSVDSLVMRSPSNSTAPPVAGSSPMITRNTVDLPAPFVPSSATTSCSRDVDVDAEQHLQRPVRRLDVAAGPARRRRAECGGRRPTTGSAASAARRRLERASGGADVERDAAAAATSADVAVAGPLDRLADAAGERQQHEEHQRAGRAGRRTPRPVTSAARCRR